MIGKFLLVCLLCFLVQTLQASPPRKDCEAKTPIDEIQDSVECDRTTSRSIDANMFMKVCRERFSPILNRLLIFAETEWNWAQARGGYKSRQVWGWRSFLGFGSHEVTRASSSQTFISHVFDFRWWSSCMFQHSSSRRGKSLAFSKWLSSTNFSRLSDSALNWKH